MSVAVGHQTAQTAQTAQTDSARTRIERTPIERLFFSAEEAAEATGLSRAEIFRLCADGSLYSVKYKRRRLIPADALRAFGERLRAGDFEGG